MIINRELPDELPDECIYNFIKQVAIIFQVPLTLITKNTKYENYGKETGSKI